MTRSKLNLVYLLILLFASGCGYKPILVGTDYDFSIQVNNSKGDSQINSRIENKLKSLSGINRTFKINLDSNETKNILSKDSKGDPTILEIVINLSYLITENGKVLINRSLSQKSTYNNILDKFELSKSEDFLRENLVENLVSDIINTASSLIQNPIINDN